MKALSSCSRQVFLDASKSGRRGFFFLSLSLFLSLSAVFFEHVVGRHAQSAGNDGLSGRRVGTSRPGEKKRKAIECVKSRLIDLPAAIAGDAVHKY